MLSRIDIVGQNGNDGLAYDTTELVVNDLYERRKLGISKYGEALNKNTDEDMLQHLYEELLDASQYIRTLLEQRKINVS